MATPITCSKVWITIAVMCAALMAVLDISIVNVGLSDIRASFGTPLDQIPVRIESLKRFRKPIICNEDPKSGAAGAQAAELCVASGASWGFMAEEVNQHHPFSFDGSKDDPVVYAKLKELTSPGSSPDRSPGSYFPPPESEGGWRKLDDPESIRRLAGMDPDRLTELRAWLRRSDDRDFRRLDWQGDIVGTRHQRRNARCRHWAGSAPRTRWPLPRSGQRIGTIA